MTLNIHLLGQFKLEANGETIELPSRPAQSLLAYLALNKGVIYRREMLASLFWMDSTESNARGYLRQALWRIRKAFGEASLPWESYLEISDINICFKPQDPYWLDTEEFLKADEDTAITELLERTRLYQGELLPGFYDEWVLLERDRLQSAYQQRMAALLQKLIEAKRWKDAIQSGEAWVRLGNSPEPAFRALMQAYAGTGDLAMASNTYQRCIDLLDRELGLGPTAETRSLYDQILQDSQAPDRHEEVTPPVPEIALPEFMQAEVKGHLEPQLFVSREEELSCLLGHLENAIQKQGSVTFVTGEAGSGKSALLNEFIRQAQKSHPALLVATGNCNAHTGMGDPFLPFREILEMLTGDVQSRWAAGVVSSQHARLLWESTPITAQAIVSAGPGLIYTFLQSNPLLERVRACISDQPDWFTRLASLIASAQTESITAKPVQADLFEQYSRVLLSIAESRPLLIVLDDLQWADPGSINLLFHLGRQIASGQILIVGAYRSEEIAIGREGERHPLAPVVSELQRIYGDCAVNLDQVENREFLEALIDTEPNHLNLPFRDMLYRQTRGQPLFTLELLRGLQERGALVQDQDQHWVEGSPLDWERLPARVEAVIKERINRLSPFLQRALRIASVEGEVFTAEVVAEVMGVASTDLLTQLSEELDRKHRLVRAQSIQRINGKLVSRYRFKHIQIQMFLYSSLNQVERVHLHERVGYALEALHEMEIMPADLALLSTTSTPVIQLARHFQEARIDQKVVHYLHLAGERAVQLSAYKEGFSHIKQGLKILLSQPDSPARARQELVLQFSLGKARKGITSMAFDEVEQIHQRSLELCHQVGDPSMECQVLGELATVYYVRGKNKTARKYSLQMLELSRQLDDPIILVVSKWMMGYLSFALGEFAAAKDYLQQVRDFYTPSEHFSKFVYLHGVDSGLSAMAYEACCLWCLGYPDQALALAERSIELGRASIHPFTLADTVTYGGCLLNEMHGDIEKVKAYAEEIIFLADLVGISWRGAGLRFRGGAIALLGDLENGFNEVRTGMQDEMELASLCTITGTLGSLAQAFLNANQFETSIQLLDEASGLIEENSERYCESEIHRIRAEVFQQMGNEAAAELSYQKALEVSRQQQARSWELRAATGLARMWQLQGKQKEAHALLSDVYNWFTEGFETPDLLAANSLLAELAP